MVSFTRSLSQDIDNDNSSDTITYSIFICGAQNNISCGGASKNVRVRRDITLTASKSCVTSAPSDPATCTSRTANTEASYLITALDTIGSHKLKITFENGVKLSIDDAQYLDGGTTQGEDTNAFMLGADTADKPATKIQVNAVETDFFSAMTGTSTIRNLVGVTITGNDDDSADATAKTISPDLYFPSIESLKIYTD